MPFGAYHGKAIGMVIQEDPHYCAWLIEQPEVRDHYPEICTLIEAQLGKQ